MRSPEKFTTSGSDPPVLEPASFKVTQKCSLISQPNPRNGDLWSYYSWSGVVCAGNRTSNCCVDLL
uniref:Uncharacterized protein MANES_03G207400 n=1 Tax=Rhizophora mucronata TaxID=61149 RepID=A0A2P2M5C1_RHIMU